VFLSRRFQPVFSPESTLDTEAEEAEEAEEDEAEEAEAVEDDVATDVEPRLALMRLGSSIKGTAA
jgi:hypothetical protein